MSELLLSSLVRAQFTATLAILIVLATRSSARSLLGPVVAYRLWALPVAAAAASLFPTFSEFRVGILEAAAPKWFAPTIHVDAPAALLSAWLAGATALATTFLVAELRFRLLTRNGLAGPAIVGVAAPRLVVPRDYCARFTDRERALVRRHERAHLDQNHPLTNGLIALFQVIGWFNPLVHLAAATVRLDQEIACDFLVLENRPKDRRLYGETLLKAQLGAGTGSASPLSCAWSGFGRHPLEIRLRALATCRTVSDFRHLGGAAVIAAAAIAGALLVWAAGPSQVSNPQPPCVGSHLMIPLR